MKVSDARIQMMSDEQRQEMNAMGCNALLVLLRHHHPEHDPRRKALSSILALAAEDTFEALALSQPTVTAAPSGKIDGDDLKVAERPEVTIDEIKLAVCKHFGVHPMHLVGASKAKRASTPRQIAMYLCRHLTPFSTVTIGNLIGGRDHTTILHGTQNVSKWIEVDKNIASDVKEIIQALGVKNAEAYSYSDFRNKKVSAGRQASKPQPDGARGESPLPDRQAA